MWTEECRNAFATINLNSIGQIQVFEEGQEGSKDRTALCSSTWNQCLGYEDFSLLFEEADVEENLKILNENLWCPKLILDKAGLDFLKRLLS